MNAHITKRFEQTHIATLHYPALKQHNIRYLANGHIRRASRSAAATHPISTFAAFSHKTPVNPTKYEPFRRSQPRTEKERQIPSSTWHPCSIGKDWQRTVMELTRRRGWCVVSSCLGWSVVPRRQRWNHSRLRSTHTI